MNATTYGVDIAKTVMQVYWVDGETGELGSRAVRRAQPVPFFANRPVGRVVIEAWGSAHYWARTLGALGHEVRLIHARHVRAYDAQGYRNGREFAACLGLVPRHRGTGGKVSVGALSKRGDPYLRTLLMHGARSVIYHTKHKSAWLEQMLVRRPLNVVVAALANKMARTAWALVAHGRDYQVGGIAQAA